MNRRTLIKGAGVGLGLAAVNATPANATNVLQTILGKAGVDTRGTKTPIKHLVVVMQENRSIDHLLGWYGAENPEFDGNQHAEVRDLRQGPNGPMVSTANWGRNGLQNFHGRGHKDPSHGWDGGRYEFAGGTLGGWLDPRTNNDEFCLAYYDATDVPVWAQLARQYQTYDRWHCSLLGPTEPNRYYLHSGQSGGLKNNDLPPQYAQAGHSEWTFGWDWDTIWTLLDRYGVSSAYYYGNLPVLAYWGPRHMSSMRHVSEFYAQAEAGTLPAVSFVDPYFTEGDDFGTDDHPHADLRMGEAFLSDLTEAFINSPNYKHGAMVITYDEWGGFYDHVVPPRVGDDRGTPEAPAGPEDFGQLGFRVPTTIVSPWTRGHGVVDHTVYEHSSVTRFIQDNWHLPNLTMRTASTNSIEHAFRGFQHRNNESKFKPYQAPMGTYFESGMQAIESVISSELENPHVPGLDGVELPTPGLATLREMGWMDKFGIRTDWKLADAFSHARPELIAATRAQTRANALR